MEAMHTVRTRTGKKYVVRTGKKQLVEAKLGKKYAAGARTATKQIVRVILPSEQKHVISPSDAEMDARAVEAVKSAVAKAKFCRKPVARYDAATKSVYVEYADGVRKYVD